ncbi:hypothetical protein BH24ACT9_BH24ACT9_18750 [soil metagenome]
MTEPLTSIAQYRVKLDAGGIEGPLFVEIFEWADRAAAGRAHTHPRVSELWESIGQLCQGRGERPKFEFHAVRPLDL